MSVRELLLNTLEELNKENFGTFKWYLQSKVLEECKPIPLSRLEEAPRTTTVSQLIDNYGDDLAVKITVEILKKQQLNNVAKTLNSSYLSLSGNVAPASSSTPAGSTSSTLNPAAAPGIVSAQDRSVIIAPTLSSSSTGTWNITINQ